MEQTAVRMLIEEVEKRTQIQLRVSSKWSKNPVILVGQHAVLRSNFPDIIIPAGDGNTDGYQILSQELNGQPIVIVAGNDARGVLFGVGRLLRVLRMSPKSIEVSDQIDIRTSPEYPLRGHQIGYRPKPNSYDAWTPAMMEQYIRDLVVFGTNAIELIPPRSDDRSTSPHFPLPKMDMMIKMSEICADYGLDVWVWYPAIDEDYSEPATVEFALKEWGGVLKQLAKLDAILVPCGDPGHTPPEVLMPLLEKQANQLSKYHKDVQWWVAPQGFDENELETFRKIVKGKPEWLHGLVYGPGVRMSLPQLVDWLPEEYPIRHYPDITHSHYCQYPVPDWDPAMSIIAGREVSNPRPMDFAAIFRRLQPHTIGFITYSEGCHDDVNKIVWSCLGWDAEMTVQEILRQYSQYFIGEDYRHDFTQLILALEKNWKGPVATNPSIKSTYLQFKSIASSAPEAVKNNWRFQLAFWRATLDLFIQKRLLSENSIEENALAALEQARESAVAAATKALNILKQAEVYPLTDGLRKELLALGDELFENIGLQLAEKHQPSRFDAAVLARLDFPLSNRLWLEAQLKELSTLSSEQEQLAKVHAILYRTDPGPGGFYDNLGAPTSEPHLVVNDGFHLDPVFSGGTLNSFDFLSAYSPERFSQVQHFPLSWLVCGIGLFDNPISLTYDDLDPEAQYTVRAVYASQPIQLVADHRFLVHDFVDGIRQVHQYDVPLAATEDGSLTLSWHKPAGVGQSQMRHLVCEVMLIKK